METFLLKKGETLIRAFEAGARTSMRMGPRMGNLSTLVEETAGEKSIAYIIIFDESGQLIASAGEPPDKAQLTPLVELFHSDNSLTRSFRTDSGETIFEVAKPFSPINAMPMRMSMMRRWQGPGESDSRLAIYLGLYTTDFVAARNEDIKQSLILFSTLLLVGSGGLYGLFLSHRSRITKSALENMEIYTDNVIHSMPAGLLTIDNDRRIVSANRNAQDYLGLAEKDLIGKTFAELMATNDCPLDLLLNEEKEFNDLPVDCLRHDNVTIPLKVSASCLRDRNDDLRGMVLTLRDQREIRAMEEAVERSRRHAALGRMAAGIAHEVRNPLGTLRGFAQYFSRLEATDSKAQEYADLMIGEVDRLNRTVSALLQFSRPREPEMKPFDLCPLLKRAVTMIQADADNQQVMIDLLLPDAPLELTADPDLIQQVLLNLLQNSLGATSAGDQITLSAICRESVIELVVRDSGKGLSAEELSKMFDPFYTTRKDGTGLGLAVVQQIVEQHNGQIEVESLEDHGTCITVTLPMNRGPHDNIG